MPFVVVCQSLCLFSTNKVSDLVSCLFVSLFGILNQIEHCVDNFIPLKTDKPQNGWTITVWDEKKNDQAETSNA